VACALVSALADRPLPGDAVWFGEVSLAGEIRPVAHAPLRLREAAKLGFARCYGPAGGGKHRKGRIIADSPHLRTSLTR
jgi:DNA repair protein RadA/Sms